LQPFFCWRAFILVNGAGAELGVCSMEVQPVAPPATDAATRRHKDLKKSDKHFVLFVALECHCAFDHASQANLARVVSKQKVTWLSAPRFLC